MAKTSAERQRDWRRRQRERQIPVADLEAWKAEARRWGEARKDEIAALCEQVARLEDELAASGSLIPRAKCGQCGGELACPACYRGEDYELPGGGMAGGGEGARGAV